MRRSLTLALLAAVAALLAAAPADAAIGFRSQRSGQNGGGSTSVTVNVPPGTTTGDVMIASVDSAGVLPTAPGGWNLINSGSGAGFAGAIYWRAATNSEPANYSWTFGSSVKAVAGISTYTGVNTTYPIGSFTTNFGTGTAAVAPSTTPAALNSMIVIGVAANVTASTTVTSPGGTNQRTNVASGTGPPYMILTSADFSQASAANTPTKTFTLSTSQTWTTQTLALTPSGGSLSFGTAPALGTLSGVTLNGSAQATNTTMTNFMVDDETGSKAGWNVTVQGDSGAGTSAVFKQYCPNATCGTDTGPGYIAGGATLPAGSLTLNSTGGSFTGGSNTAPTLVCGSGCSIDAASPVRVASAAAGGGTAQWTTTGFSGTSLSLATPNTLRALKTNEVYRANVLWTLSSGP